VHRLVRLTLAASVMLAAIAATVTGTATGASAAGVCGSRTTTKAFTRWLDYADYFTVPAGTFESGATGWTTAGAVEVVADQEPWRVLGSTHGKALSIRSTSSMPAVAMSPQMCITTGEQWVRFFYRDPGVLGAGLKMQILVGNSYGWRLENSATIWSGTAGWKVSSQIYFPKITDLSGAQTVQIVVTPVFTPAAWAIDDIQIDPWVSR
jgi:hypothetical protein